MDNSLLDSSLIFTTLYRTQSNLFHDIKVVDCGSYIQVYRLSSFKKNPKDSYNKFDFLLDNSIENIDIDFLFKLDDIVGSSKQNIARNESMKFLEEKNVIRSKLSCQRLAKCNSEEWKSFLTLTFEDNIQDVTVANKLFRMYIDKIARCFRGFKYIAIPEFQSRGAVHYHLLTNLECGCKFIPLQQPKKIWNPTTKRFKTFEYYNLKFWSYGFSQAQCVSGDVKKIIGYISKYMTKDIDTRLFGKHRYFYSRNLNRPVVSYLNSFDEKHVDFLKRLIGDDNNVIYSNTYKNYYNDDDIVFEEYYR